MLQGGWNLHLNPVVQYEQRFPLWDTASVKQQLCVCSSCTGTLGGKHEKISPMSINTNRAPCSIVCYTQKPMHVRKRIISGDRGLILLHIYQLNYLFQQKVHARVCACKKHRERKHKGENIVSSSLTAQCCSTGIQLDIPGWRNLPHLLPGGTAIKINKYWRAVFCTWLRSDLCGESWLYHRQHKPPKIMEDVFKETKWAQ